MKLELSKELISEIKELVLVGNSEQILIKLKDFHPADIAEILDIVNLEEAKFLYKTLPEDISTDVLVELDLNVRELFLKALSSEEIAEMVHNMDEDDAVDILQEISDEKKDLVLSKLNNTEYLAQKLEKLIEYNEDVVGSLMDTQIIIAKTYWTREECIELIRKKSEDVEQIHHIYVVNENNLLKGVLSLKNLLVSKNNTLVKNVYDRKYEYLEDYESIESAAKKLKKYNLTAMPVVDLNHNLLGRITFDDVMDIMTEEAEKDYQMASGLSNNVDLKSNIYKSIKARIPWLTVGLAGGILSSKILGLFENSIDSLPFLAFFIPLITAMGGNVGVQSSAIIVQSIAQDDVNFESLIKKLSKEFLISLINGFLLSLIIFLFISLIDNDIRLAFSVSISLISVILFAGLFGTFIPLFLHKRNIDPALATGPFITTTNDIIGLIIYFTISYFIFF